jgi:transcriptional regulator with XRE-family HTH domain
VLGELLRTARVDAKLTQEQLAAKAGIHRTYVSLVERDLRSPTVQMLLRICRAANVSASSIVARLESER